MGSIFRENRTHSQATSRFAERASEGYGELYSGSFVNAGVKPEIRDEKTCDASTSAARPRPPINCNANKESIQMALSAPSGTPLVLIDGREISKKRGIGHFCRELLYNINAHAGSTNTRYVCLIPEQTPVTLQGKFDNIALVTRKMLHPIVWEQIVLPTEALLRRATHLICPYNTFPILTPPNLTRIIVFHDLIFLHASRVGGGTNLFFGNKYRSV